MKGTVPKPCYFLFQNGFLQVLILCEPVHLGITYRLFCSIEKSSEILSSSFIKKDTKAVF